MTERSREYKPSNLAEQIKNRASDPAIDPAVRQRVIEIDIPAIQKQQEKSVDFQENIYKELQTLLKHLIANPDDKTAKIGYEQFSQQQIEQYYTVLFGESPDANEDEG